MTSQTSQLEPGGNTKTPGAHPNQLYRWILTIPYEEYNSESLYNDLKDLKAKEFYYQAEQGEGETQYKHWQVCLCLSNKEYFGTIKNWFPSSTHIESCKNWHAAKKYCNKKETRIEGPYDHNSTFIKILKELRPWQAELEIELVKECTDDRKVIAYVDHDGGQGKTVFCKYMAVKHKALILSNGKSSDLAYAAKCKPKIVLFNITRTVESRLNYGAIEALKDGLIFSGKYESETMVFNCPHVVIFTNSKPNLEMMSKDRWDIRYLGTRGPSPLPRSTPSPSSLRLTVEEDSVWEED